MRKQQTKKVIKPWNVNKYDPEESFNALTLFLCLCNYVVEMCSSVVALHFCHPSDLKRHN